MRVGVDLVGFAVGGPAGVADAEDFAGVFGGQGLFQGGDSAGGFKDADAAARHQGHARGVISAIFEPLEAFDQDRPGGFLSEIGNDSTHGVNPFCPIPGICFSVGYIVREGS